MYKKKKTAKININTQNMGIDIDKNEFREIVLSNTNRPETLYSKKNLKSGSFKRSF